MQHGSVRQRGATYTALWREPDPTTGKPRQRSQGGYATEDDAWRFLRRRLVELETGLPVRPAEITLAEYLDLWFAGKRALEPASRSAYEVQLRLHIKPYLGAVKLVELQPVAVRAWISRLLNDGRRNGTITEAFKVLSGALNLAVDDGLIPRNPARRQLVLTKSDVPDDERLRIWTEAESARFAHAVAGEPDEAFWQLLLMTQVRIGEALALRWPDVDQRHGLIHVRYNYRYNTTRDMAPTKGRRSRRVDVDDELFRLLRAHRDRQAFAIQQSRVPWPNNDLVFRSSRGRPMDPPTLRRRFTQLCAPLGVRRLTLHELRHTGASHLLAAGVPVHVVSARLGHKDATITMRVYAHVLPHQQREAALLLRAILAGSDEVVDKPLTGSS